MRLQRSQLATGQFGPDAEMLPNLGRIFSGSMPRSEPCFVSRDTTSTITVLKKILTAVVVFF